MSYKLVDLIMKNKSTPGKYRRVLAAWASFARKDGSNCFPSKEAVADRAGISRWTVYRNTDVLIEKNILVPDGKHTYPNGHWTTIYHIDIDALNTASWEEAMLQNATGHCSKTPLCHCSKTPKSLCSKMPKTSVAKGDAKGDIERGIPEHSDANPHRGSKEVSELDAQLPTGASLIVGGSGAQLCSGQDGTGEPPASESESQPVSTPVSQSDAWKFMWKPEYEELYREGFRLHPFDLISDEDKESFLWCVLDLEDRYKLTGTKWKHPVLMFLWWNRTHKKGKLVLTCGRQLRKAMDSKSPSSILRQFDLHMTRETECTLCGELRFL